MSLSAIAAVAAGLDSLVDGVLGQVLTVQGDWSSQQGVVSLDAVEIDTTSAPSLLKSDQADHTKATTHVADKLVITGAVSGTTLLSLPKIVAPAKLIGVPLVESDQPIPDGSFILAAHLVSGSQTYRLVISGKTVTLAASAPPSQEPVAVPSLHNGGLLLLSAVMAGWGSVISRRRKQISIQ